MGKENQNVSLKYAELRCLGALQRRLQNESKQASNKVAPYCSAPLAKTRDFPHSLGLIKLQPLLRRKPGKA